MKNFTPTDCKPSELTLHIIRTIAHNFPTLEQIQSSADQGWN